MKKSSIAGYTLLLLLPGLAFAHRLDEYLQAALLSVDQNHVRVDMRLVPGVAVAPQVIASIDTNGDGLISSAEQQTYVNQVIHDLSLAADGRALALREVAADFPSIGQMKQGTGEIHLELIADLPAGNRQRQLTFENHHRSGISVYLVNSLIPEDKRIQITAQQRNENQSFYQLDYVDDSNSAPVHASVSTLLSGFAGAFHLGLRHIAEGTDHLLFLLALLLPAPLVAGASRWEKIAGVGPSLRKILTIVTFFTLGHSLTLALAASGLVHVPERPIEVLIAVSIFVSAVHAIRPLFPGRENLIAGSFGLIHGLAFAAALNALGFGGRYLLVSLVGFNLGIETMQLAVVAATLPSLLLLSRTRVYSPFRVGGALFCVVVSAGWIVERLFNLPSSVDPIVARCAHFAPWIALALFVTSVVCWSLPALREAGGADWRFARNAEEKVDFISKVNHDSESRDDSEVERRIHA